MEKKTKCPFCEGSGCCNCDHTGFVPYGEGQLFKSKEEADNHDPEISLHDLEKHPEWVREYKQNHKMKVH